MILYKFTNLIFIPSCIENGIYASKLDYVNDPYEEYGIRYPDRYRICCMTKSSMQMLMWAYYGNHKGCCVEFNVPEDAVREVTYTEEFQFHEDMTNEQIIESLYKKGKEWEKEHEYRSVYYEPKANRLHWSRNGDNIFLKAEVKTIILGYLSHFERSDYIKTLGYLRDLNDDNIRVTKCRLQNGRYQFKQDRQFDVIHELKSFQ